jgi:hypothetical protein
MAYTPNSDFYLDIARGAGPAGWLGVNKFGRNQDVDAAEDIWGTGGNWVAPTAARVHAIVSNDANDTSAGTGARTVYVEGLNGSYAATSETVTMNGLASVNTANSYVIIHRMYVATAGTGEINAGNITATAAVDATVSITIIAGMGQTTFGIYQVPAGYTAYVLDWDTSFQNANANSTADVAFFVKPFGGAWNLKSEVGLSNAGDSMHTYEWRPRLKVLEKSIIKVRCTGVANANADIQTSFDLVLIPN